MFAHSNDLFNQKKLRKTPVRTALYNLLRQVDRPLSHAEIISQDCMTNFDRVTIYRTLDTFQQAGLLHKISGQDGIWRFGIHSHHSNTACKGNHGHFLCDNCQIMTCLPDQPLPRVTAPGAIIYSKQLVVRGLCALCNAINTRSE